LHAADGSLAKAKAIAGTALKQNEWDSFSAIPENGINSFAQSPQLGVEWRAVITDSA
jgi:hypothetical protein